MDSLYPMDEENLQQLESWLNGDGDLCSEDGLVGNQNPYGWIQKGQRLFCNGIGYVRILADAEQRNGIWTIRVLPILRNGQESSKYVNVKAEKITTLISPAGEVVRPRSKLPPKRFCDEHPADTHHTHIKKVKRNFQIDPKERFYEAYHYQDDVVSNTSFSSDEDFESLPTSSDDESSTDFSVDSESNSLANLSDLFNSCVDRIGTSAAASDLDDGDGSTASGRTWDTQ